MFQDIVKQIHFFLVDKGLAVEKLKNDHYSGQARVSTALFLLFDDFSGSVLAFTSVNSGLLSVGDACVDDLANCGPLGVFEAQA